MAAAKEQMKAEKLCAPEKPSPTFPANLGFWGPSFFIGPYPLSPEVKAVAPRA
jgi:hypothetical protein